MTDGGGTMPANAIDARGRHVVFLGNGPRLQRGASGGTGLQIWSHDRADDSLVLVTHTLAGPQVRSTGSFGVFGTLAMSADGAWVAFVASAPDLVAASGTAAMAHLYLWNRLTGELHLITHAAGAPGIAASGATVDLAPHVSADGRFVLYLSNATNLVAGQSGAATNNLFLYDRHTDASILVTHANGNPTQAVGGVTGTFALTPDGAFVAFASTAANLTSLTDTNNASDVFVHARATGANLTVSRSGSAARTANFGSTDADISADGNRVVFRSQANDLMPGTPTPDTTTTDVFVWQRSDDSMRLVSHHPTDALQPANGNASVPQIDDAGRRVLFASTATDLVSGFVSPHAQAAAFAWDAATNAVQLVGHAAGSSTRDGNAPTLFPVLARDGSRVAFVSRGDDFVPNQADADDDLDVYLADLDTREIFLASHRIGEPNVAGMSTGAPLAVAVPIAANGEVVGFHHRGNDLVRHDVAQQDTFVYVHDEPVRPLINRLEPSPARAGEAFAVEVELDVAKGPALGRVVVSDGSTQCQFDLDADDDNRGQCQLVAATVGPKTITARFTSEAGFEDTDATARTLTVLPPPAADLAIALQAPASLAPGQTFELRVQSTNTGPDGAGSVAIDFAGLPAVTSSSGPGWTCTASPAWRCTRDSFPLGMGEDLVLQLVAPGEDATLAMQATIFSPVGDPVSSNNARNATVQVDAAPRVFSISPPGGSTEGGYPLQISGANFGTAAGRVDLAGLPCGVTLWTPTQIVCTVPPGAGLRDLQVIQAASVLDRTSFSAFAYDAPDIDTLSPVVGDPAGNFPLTVSGRDFGAQDATVTIAGLACTNVQHDATRPHRRVTCTVPAGTGTNLPVVVTQSGQSSEGNERFAYASVVADLLIDKASARTEVLARGSDEWTLLVSNLGPDRADGTRIVDVLPAHLQTVAWTCIGLAGATCGTPQGLGDIDLFADLPAGGSALLQVSARIPRAPLIDVVNNARVETPAGIVDPLPDNNTDTETDPMATVFFDDFEPD